ncbi:hypothetical protein B4O97_04095 [Marispirochaeta aestuarii]|uniref:Carbohydrate kinase PfkB domain-containing protein n=1 Tax=Marispirochaeta aestuarii TaxID=1963862 RepID=A0A1Y1S1L5_9SPIO|nr:carbohydrate kinase family protein [Marispirochaeta aestuarii]ORC37380.1 hypothetical protein B4O97_04095 [Marispirochaeta aestuarii]
MKRILGLGGIAYDILSVIPNMPAWEEVEYIEEYQVQQGGMVATGLVTAAKLGADTEIISAIGNDTEGMSHLENFNRFGIKCDNVMISNENRSAVTLVLIHSSTGRRSFIHYKGVNGLSNLNINKINYENVSHMLFDGFFFETALKAAIKARKMNIVTVTDLSPKNRDPRLTEYLKYIDYPVLSELFLCSYTNISDPIEAGKSLLQNGNKALIVTCGEKGSYIIKKDGIENIPAYKVNVIDSTGAGDVFHGAFIFALWKGYDLKKTVRFANACAAINCQTVGGQKGIPTLEEVQEFTIKKEKMSLS